MKIDNIIDSNVLGIAGFDKDFYALVGSSTVLFGMTYYLVVHYLKKIDAKIDQEKLLGNSAGSIIDKVKASYKVKDIKWTGDQYQKLVNDRNKIAHGFIVKTENKKTSYCYISNKGDKGELSEQFFLEFIDSCNMFIGAIVVQDSEMKEKYNLFKEIK